MERDYGGASSPPLSDGETITSTAPKLSALFAMEQQKLQSGNSSFRYHPPKLPAMQSTAAKVVPVPGFGSNLPGPSESINSAPSLQVLHSVAVLQLLMCNPSGGKAFVGNAAMAILETSSSQAQSYQLVLYDASKRTLANTPVTRDFLCTPKADLWVNFSTVNQSWSALFKSTEDWADFARAVVLVRSVVARASNSFSGVIMQDISPQQDIPQSGLRDGDMVQVTYKAWIERPGHPGSLGHCFQETAGKGKKLELGSGKAIQGLEKGVIGMTKSSRRLFITPPHLGFLSAAERQDRVPADAILFFDVTVSRTRRHKASVSEASYGKELLSDQLSYSGDAGSEREELTASNSVNINDDVKMANSSIALKDDIEENVQEHRDLTNEKRELLIDRMAKLSRIGGAGSYSLPSSSVAASHKRFTVETSQPLSDGFDHFRDSSTQESSMVADPGIIDSSPKSTSTIPVSNEGDSDRVLKLSIQLTDSQEDGRSESENHLLDRSEVDEEIHQFVSSPTFSQHVDHQQPKSDDGSVKNDLVTDAPSVSEPPGGVEDVLGSSNAEVPAQIRNSNPCCVPTSTGADHPSNSEALRPQSGETTIPSSFPTVAGQWAQGSSFAFPPLAFPTPGTSASNFSEIPPPYPMMNPAAQFPPMGPSPFAPTSLPGQGTQPYLGHPALVPWFPWGFPQYAPPPFSVPAAESKHENQQAKILQNIQRAQESLADSLRELTVKVEALTEGYQKRSGLLDCEQSSGHCSSGIESGSKGANLPGQGNSEDGDVQVDSVVESVALMLAENRELRRRLSEYKKSYDSERGPSIEQYYRGVRSNKEEDKWVEDAESSAGIPSLNLARKTQPDLEFEPTTLSPRDFLRNETEMTMFLSNDMKLVMNKVYREVAGELRQSPDIEQSLPVVHQKLMDGVDAMIQVLRDKALFASPFKVGLDLDAISEERGTTSKPPPKHKHAGLQQEMESSLRIVGRGSPADAGMVTGGGELDISNPDNASLQVLDGSDDCSRLADHEELKRLSERNFDTVNL